MKQLLILSGKGGTGKTTVAGAFIRLAEAQAFADCDVDAPNLHLLLAQSMDPTRTDYFGMPKAVIDESICISCGKCLTHCRFNAIQKAPKYAVDEFACEGCGVCEAVCPVHAATLKPDIAGEQMCYRDDHMVFSTARLKMGRGTSGLLVTEVKKTMQENAPETAPLTIIDGSPGIGCPVIASLSGVDMVLIVAEPSLSGISDMERIIKTAAGFNVATAVCINKYDTNPTLADQIEGYCRTHNLAFTGRIPYDPEAVKAINKGQSIVDVACPAGTAVRDVYQHTISLLIPENAPIEAKKTEE